MITLAAALAAVTGLLFTMSPTFAKGIYKSQSGAGRTGSLAPDGSLITTTEEERKIGNNVAAGIVITILGTLMNAFGDMVAGRLFG